MTQQTWNNDPELKAKYTTKMQSHALADEISKGTYWENGKGCAIGCLVETSDDPHIAFEKARIGPEWLAELGDVVFEGLPNNTARQFAVDFPNAILVGKTFAELDLVKWKLCSFILRENIERVLQLKISEDLKSQVVTAIRRCLAVQENAIRTGAVNESDATLSSALSARSSALSARSASSSAYGSVAYWSALSSALSASSSSLFSLSALSSALSARSSAYGSVAYGSVAYGSVAYGSALSDAYGRYASELLRLLGE